MKKYITIFILLLVTEIAIAYFQFSQFVRGFLGDVLVIPLLYTFVRIFTKLSRKTVLIFVLSIAFAIEFLQLFSIGEWLQLENKLARIVLGNTFDGWDLLAYWFGIIPVLIIEKMRSHGTN